MASHLLDESITKLEQRMLDYNEPPFRARQLARWALQHGVTSFEEMTNIPASLRTRLSSELTLLPPAVLAETSSDDGSTIKVLLDLNNGASVEAVRMNYDPDPPQASESRYTANTRIRSTCLLYTSPSPRD